MRSIEGAIILLSFLTLSCTKSPTFPSSGSPTTQLLVNPTFQWKGVPSLYGWSKSDSLRLYYSNDVPPGGSGNTIVFLPTGTICEGIQQIIPALPGTHVYRLTFFGKSQQLDAGANVNLHPSGRDVFIGNGGATAYNTTWTFYSVVDTFTTVPGDSLYITVQEAGCEICEPNASAYINSCMLEVN